MPGWLKITPSLTVWPAGKKYMQADSLPRKSCYAADLLLALLSRKVSELFCCCFEMYVILNCSIGEMCNQAISFVGAMHTHCLLSYWTRAKHSKFPCLGHVKMTKNKICMQLWQKQYYWLWLVKSKGYVKLLGYFFNRYLLCSGLRDFADNKLYIIIF